MNKEQKRGLLNLVLILIFFVICFAACERDRLINRTDIVYGCGTYLVERELNNEQKIGTKIFNSNCAACHKFDKKLIGPKLENVSKESWQRFQNLEITNKDSVNYHYHRFFFQNDKTHLDSTSLNRLWQYLH
ncbi:c-type cytochrome [Aureivirga sp. CE67]|uniref:c-type cytochrome n=1 Tax=Aureivirga sp. CE67 TaxID=1788983 RepID=UPI0018CAC2CC|nr:c-type cytochrome [Aureivirga sp. CE67]